MADQKKPDEKDTGSVKNSRPRKSINPITSAEVWRPDLINWPTPDSTKSIVDAMLQGIDLDSHPYEKALESAASHFDSFLKRQSSYGSDTIFFQGTIRPQIDELRAEITKLKSAADTAVKALRSEKANSTERDRQVEELQETLRTLNEKEALSHLLVRVGEPAQQMLLTSEEFRSQFASDVSQNAYVISIDIRRSTELMLKAREPRLFAEFMMKLAASMRTVIIESYGIYDKFTGDGVLAFFPDFYSGEDAGYRCLSAAERCHEVFEIMYRQHRHCFTTILADVGLGIGIDYGPVHLVQLGGDFTVVGSPVVYACRMSGCAAGETLANQPAFEQLFHRFSAHCDFDETTLEIKREGKTLAHRARLNGKTFDPKLPPWLAGVSHESAEQ